MTGNDKNDRFDRLFKGEEGSVLGAHKETAPAPVEGKLKEKLIRTKQQWAKDGRLLTGEAPSAPQERRLPPGQEITRDWPVLDLGLKPNVPKEQWAFTVAGLVENPVRWDWDAFMAQPQTEITTDIHCVTQWSLYDSRWKGVSAKHVLSLVRPKANARFLVFHSHDAYTTNVPLASFDADDALLAHTWNGAPLAREHGGPVRVVIPKLYFWKSAKWVRHVVFLEKDAPGYWEVRGYHNTGDPWKEERYG
ncbi:MAG: sulfite oxidase-like oxidoreductase [Rhodospirillales bacterium]|nr:sulfite oxidase-like oxidoreductase [Rhodospirillales bacterium]